MENSARQIGSTPTARARTLSADAFSSEIQLADADLKVLNSLIRGGIPPRRSGVILGALRTKLEWGHAKPQQRHEVSHLVAITVNAAIGPHAGGGSLQAKAAPVATGQPQVLSLQPRPITALMSTTPSVDTQGDSLMRQSYVNHVDPPDNAPRVVSADTFDL